MAQADIDLTPTPNAYRRILQEIASRSTNPADRVWAKQELARVQNVAEWSPKNG